MRRSLILALVLSTALTQAVEAGPLKLRKGGSGVIIPPAPPPTDPLGVVLNGLSPVYHLKETVGPRIATTNISDYTRPAGVSYNSTTTNTDVSGAVNTALNGVNNFGHGGLYYTGNAGHTVTDFSFTSDSGVAGGGKAFMTGSTSGAFVTGNPNVDLEFGSLDFAGGRSGALAGTPAAELQSGGTGTFTLGFASVMNAPRDPFVNDSLGGTVHFTHTYWGTYAQNTTNTDHNEDHHFLSCHNCLVEYSYMNQADGHPQQGGNSAAEQVQSGIGTDPTTYPGGPVNITYDRDIWNYGAVENQVTISGKAVFDDVDIYVSNSVLNKGITAPYYGCVQQADLKVSSVTGAFVSGDSLVSGSKNAPLLGTLTGGNNLHLSSWGAGAHFTTGDNIISSSGGTATVVSASYHHCLVHDMGGNRDFAGNFVILP